MGLINDGHDDDSANRQKTSSWAERLSHFQVRHPAAILATIGAVTVAAVVLAMGLEVRTGFESLLPDNRESVQELKRVASRTAGVSTLFVLLQGREDTPVDALRRASEALVEEIGALGPPWVGSVENGIQEARRFLMPRAGLFAELSALQKVDRDLTARHEFEIAKAMDAVLDDEAMPPPVERKVIEKDLGITEESKNRYPDGYYQSHDGHTVVVAVRSKVMSNDLEMGDQAIQRIRAAVERVNPPRFHPGISVAYSGDLETGVSEYRDINRDLTSVGELGALMIIGIVFLYYLRMRAVIAMVLNIAIGVAWSFGLTRLTVGNLNVATGFLFTIVAGNGINFSIIFMARYLEERRAQASLERGIVVAHRDTWVPTLASAVAASAAYGSLMVSDFRGFRDFGLIGGAGMMICWLVTYITLPSILTVVERVVPIRKRVLDGKPQSLWRRFRDRMEEGVAFGMPFARIVEMAPRTIFTVGTALAIAGFVMLVGYISSDPMEYDLSKLRNDPAHRVEEMRLTRLAEDVTGYVGSDGMAILVDRTDQVTPLRNTLYAIRDKAPDESKPFDRVHALQDFVPADQEAKIPVLMHIRQMLNKFHQRGGISDADWDEVATYLPDEGLKPFGMADLPDAMARPFTETDGTRGRIVYISPISPDVINDARYLFRWADSYRETILPDGGRIVGSGRAVIYADMWSAVLHDIPPAVIASLLATILVVVVAFRGQLASLTVLGALMVGVGWMAGLLVLLKVKLNFLNFIALPITFGIGVDYAVNIVQRYVQEGAGGAMVAVRRTGGAVILCSLTTTLGYVALAGSMNLAVRSMGAAAVLGEIACLLAAVLVLPAGLLWLEQRRGSAKVAEQQANQVP
jgi:predicted RND superfamily exporter protein